MTNSGASAHTHEHEHVVEKRAGSNSINIAVVLVGIGLGSQVAQTAIMKLITGIGTFRSVRLTVPRRVKIELIKYDAGG